jgi:hypothetical protein
MQLINIMRFSNAQSNVNGVYLFTKHNYRAKKLNDLTLKRKIQREWTLDMQKINNV